MRRCRGVNPIPQHCGRGGARGACHDGTPRGYGDNIGYLLVCLWAAGATERVSRARAHLSAQDSGLSTVVLNIKSDPDYASAMSG